MVQTGGVLGVRGEEIEKGQNLKTEKNFIG